MKHSFAIAALGLLLSACQSGGSMPGEDEKFSEIAADEALYFTGTEPFWGGKAIGKSLTYTTPENSDGTTIPVTLFHGLGGQAYSGTLDGGSFDMMVTVAECSDGMSDREYPYMVTLKLAGNTRLGCAWTDKKPFSGPANP